MLAAAVYAGIWLFMEQADELVSCGDALHGLHGKLIIVNGDVGCGVNRGHLMLGGSRLVMLSRGGYAHLPKLDIKVLHICAYALTDGAEILILKLLTLGSVSAEERAAGIDKVSPFEIFFPVHQKILLLSANGCNYLCGGSVAKKTHYTHRLLAYRLHGTQKRRFLVQGFPGVRDKDRGDTETNTGGLLLYKGGRSDVPGGVAPGIVSGAQASGGKGGCVRLTHYKLLAGKLQKGLALLRHRYERVMLFGGDAGQRLKPVGIMRGALFHGPILHGGGYYVRGRHA